MIKMKRDKYLYMALGGYILLIIGCFLPVVTLESSVESLWIALTYNGGGDGFIILGILVLALPLVIRAMHRALIVPALLTFVIVLLNFIEITGDEFVRAIANIIYPTWFILFAGSGLLFAAAVINFMERRRTGQVSPAAA